jgi:membrane protein implicated in regulation of membrane protease activity
MEKQQLSGYIMAGVGFVMILINALSYFLGWDLKSPAFTVLGLVLIVTGARMHGNPHGSRHGLSGQAYSRNGKILCCNSPFFAT